MKVSEREKHNQEALERLHRIDRRQTSVATILKGWPLEDVAYVAEQAGIAPEGIPLEDLAELTAAEVLSRSGMQRIFITASDEEAAAFAHTVDEGVCPKEEEKDITPFNELGLTAVFEDGRIEVLPDAARSFLLYCTDAEFETERSACSWLCTCIDAMFHLYGACPKKTMYLMFRKKFANADMDEFWQAYYRIPEEKRYVTIQKDRMIYDTLTGSALFSNLGFSKEPYCIPEVEEIQDLAENGYPTGPASWKKLSAALGELNCFRDEVDRTEALCGIYEQLRLQTSPENTLKIRSLALTREQQEKLLPYVREAAEDTRCPALRGFTPLEYRNREEQTKTEQ